MSNCSIELRLLLRCPDNGLDLLTKLLLSAIDNLKPSSVFVEEELLGKCLKKIMTKLKKPNLFSEDGDLNCTTKKGGTQE